jgi:hypothetical protein
VAVIDRFSAIDVRAYKSLLQTEVDVHRYRGIDSRPLAVQERLSIEVTSHQMIGGDFLLLRLDLRALWHGEGTAGMEAASGVAPCVI